MARVSISVASLKRLEALGQRNKLTQVEKVWVEGGGERYHAEMDPDLFNLLAGPDWLEKGIHLDAAISKLTLRG